jgi:hypothetical protein
MAVEVNSKLKRIKGSHHQLLIIEINCPQIERTEIEMREEVMIEMIVIRAEAEDEIIKAREIHHPKKGIMMVVLYRNSRLNNSV